MAEAFTNPVLSVENLPAFEAVELNPVSIKQRAKVLLRISLFFVLFIAGGCVFFYFNPLDIISGIIGGIILLFFVFQYVNAFLKQPFYGYALREKDIIYQRGYLVTKTTVIPFNRIQHSAISRTLFDKIFGIASLQIYTAGGKGSDLDIPGLLPDIAKKLNAALSKKVSEDDY